MVDELRVGVMVARRPLEAKIGVRAPDPQHFGRLSASNNNMEQTWYVYMLLCDQKTFYIGMTDNMKRRLYEHQNKLSFFTKKFSDIKLVYHESYPDKYQAAAREKQLKGWSRAKKIALIHKLVL